MARPTKDGIDYFPMDVDFFTDMKVRRIKKACGPASVSILICLLCNIYRDGYYVLWNEDLPFVISEVVGVTEGAVSETILKAVNVGFFNEDMFNRHKILTSAGIQRRFTTVIKASKLKRGGLNPTFDLLISSEETAKSSEDMEESSEETSESSEESTQRKVKKSKVKHSKLPKSPEIELSGFSPTVQKTLADWFEYKRQRKDKLTDVGRQKFLSAVRNKIDGYGENAIISAMELSMSNGWQGVIWDRLDNAPRGKDASKQNNAPSAPTDGGEADRKRMEALLARLEGRAT